MLKYHLVFKVIKRKKGHIALQNYEPVQNQMTIKCIVYSNGTEKVFVFYE